jgi:hypothetical protein
MYMDVQVSREGRKLGATVGRKNGGLAKPGPPVVPIYYGISIITD